MGPRCSGHRTQRERNRKLLEPSMFQHVLATGEIQISQRKFLSSGSLQSGGLNIHMFYQCYAHRYVGLKRSQLGGGLASDGMPFL